MTSRANIAATNMEHLCNCNKHGYSQSERWGNSNKGTCSVKCEDHTSTFYIGDRDCSSAVIDSWQEALIGTKYEGKLKDATYTGNMKNVFINSGLFEWKPMSFNAVRGDIYLNEIHHTAMCLDGGNDGIYKADTLGEFAISETGGIYGQSGDQTGTESYIHGYYSYPWDGILHYNGKADVKSTSQTATAVTPAKVAINSKNRLHVIDIASWQAGITPSRTKTDAVIIKVTGGTHYENPYWKQWADDVLASGKLLGLYHFAVEGENNPQAEAEAKFFLNKVQGYIGKFIPVLDWEADACNLSVSWAKKWLDTVAKQTKATPWFYGYANNINTTDYSAIKKYPLWMASYLNKYNGAGFLDNPDQSWGYGAWDSIAAYQYTSTGRIDGYNSNLDLSVAYISKTDWRSMCGNANSITSAPSVTTNTKINQPEYNVKTLNHGWLTEMIGLKEKDGGNDNYAGITGTPCVYIGINNVGKYRVYTQASGWLPYVDHLDYKDEENGMAGDGSPILAIEIPNSKIKYQVHVMNVGWYDWMVGNKDTGNSKDTYAGDLKNPIDTIRITMA